MNFSNISGKLGDLELINEFLNPEKGHLGGKEVIIEVKGKTFGGRTVSVRSQDDDETIASFTMNDLVKHVAAKAAEDLSKKDEDLKYLKPVVDRLLTINADGKVKDPNADGK